jgi:hypothetical protein
MEISRIPPVSFSSRLYPLSPASGAAKVTQINSISGTPAVGGMKKPLDIQSDAARDASPGPRVMRDPDLGRLIDTFA